MQQLTGDHIGLDQHHRCQSDARCMLFWLFLLTCLPASTPFAVAQNHNLNYLLQSWNNLCFTTGYIKVSVVLPRQDANSAGYVSLPLYALFIFPKQVALYLLQGTVCTCTWGKCSHCCTTSPFKTPLAYLACCTPFLSMFIPSLTNLSMVTARTHSTAGRNQIPQGSRGGE